MKTTMWGLLFAAAITAVLPISEADAGWRRARRHGWYGGGCGCSYTAQVYTAPACGNACAPAVTSVAPTAPCQGVVTHGPAGTMLHDQTMAPPPPPMERQTFEAAKVPVPTQPAPEPQIEGTEPAPAPAEAPAPEPVE